MANTKKTYLYGVCLITMALSIFAAIRLINTLLNWLFDGTRQYSWGGYELALPLAMLVVSAPLFFIHWRMAKREQ